MVRILSELVFSILLSSFQKLSCVENEGVKYAFGIPGEENLDLMDVVRSSSQVLTLRLQPENRHETQCSQL